MGYISIDNTDTGTSDAAELSLFQKLASLLGSVVFSSANIIKHSYCDFVLRITQ